MTERDRVDWVHVARGASRGFTFLVLGGLLTPALSRLPVVGMFALTLVAVTAFAAAGLQVGDATAPMIQGALAALCSYVLVLPLVAMVQALEPGQFVLTLLVATIVGAAAGYLRNWTLSRRGAAGTSRHRAGPALPGDA